MSFQYGQYEEGFNVLRPSPDALRFSELVDLRGRDVTIIHQQQVGCDGYGTPEFVESEYRVKALVELEGGEMVLPSGEMNFIRDDEDLYTAVLFTLNTTDGYLFVESTPWNSDSVFYDIFHKEEYSEFSKHRLVYSEAMPPHGPLTQSIVEMIEKQLRGDPSRWRREMLCEWTEDNNKWLPMNLITYCQNPTITYWGSETQKKGRFYVGVDFGKKQDHSVVAVMEKKMNHYILRHCHRFKLNTSYGTVIGYVKKLQDSWDTLLLVNCDQTGVGEYIVEDMKRMGVRNVNGVIFTEARKEEMATILKETMRQIKCDKCGWQTFIETMDKDLRKKCPRCGSPLQPVFQIPYDQELFIDLNTPVFTLGKNGKIQFSHRTGTHDDMFWAISLSLYFRKKGFTKPLATN